MSTKKSSKKISGICQLTNVFGPFVKSHLIPEALTRLSKTGEKFFEAGHGYGRKKVSSSWYDTNLVTRNGEDILGKIDSAGIKELRRYRLIWSGWGDEEQRLRDDEIDSSGDKVHLRSITFEFPDVLRIFFLSLLWRAAASTRPEFSDIKLSSDDLEDIRLRILANQPGRDDDYPIQFHQIFTRGEHHNRTPFLENHPWGLNGSLVSCVRFYFEGLVTNIYLARDKKLDTPYLRFCVGFSNPTLVIAHKYNDSRAEKDIEEIKAIEDEEPYKRMRRRP